MVVLMSLLPKIRHAWTKVPISGCKSTPKAQKQQHFQVQGENDKELLEIQRSLL
jgi:hypothetical protein